MLPVHRYPPPPPPWGYQRLWEWNSQVLSITSDFSCYLLVAKCMLAPLAHDSAHSPCTIRRHRHQFHPCFLLLSLYPPPAHSTIHATGILIDIILVGSSCTTSRCLSPSTSYANHVTELDDLRAAFNSRSSIPPDPHRHFTHRVVSSGKPPLFLLHADRCYPR